VKNKKRTILLLAAAILLFAVCATRAYLGEFGSISDIPAAKDSGPENTGKKEASNFSSLLQDVLAKAELPQNISLKIQESVAADSAFIKTLFSILQEDPYLRILIDKEHPLPGSYEPDDLVKLANGSYKARSGILLRSAAAASLEEMGAAAKKKGLMLEASSAYRSYNYQTNLYKRNVDKLGKQAADRGTARPGYSQHQLGLVVDFGSITNAFAQTKEGRWLADNASNFGWSLSYPKEHEDITGYRWESWHWRYTGKELAGFIDTYFEGIQQYALRFLHEWQQAKPSFPSP